MHVVEELFCLIFSLMLSGTFTFTIATFLYAESLYKWVVGPPVQYISNEGQKCVYYCLNMFCHKNVCLIYRSV